jgi:hypothetical protein
MKITYTLLISLLFSLACHSQITFQRAIGASGNDAGYSVQQVSGGGYIISGYTNDFAADSGIYLVRLGPTGGVIWTKIFNFSQYFNYDGSSVQQTYDGGYIVAGFASEHIDLIKTDAIGDTLWTKTYGGSVYDVARSVIQTSDSGYAILGATLSFGAGGYDIYLIKTDASGNLLWTRTYGGTGEDQGYEVRQTFDGGYIITGFTDNNSTTLYRACLIKTDASGNLGWIKNIYELASGNWISYGYSVKQTADSGYVIAGRSKVDNVYLVKTDTSGNVIWSHTYGGPGVDFGNSVQQTTDGGYMVAGYAAGFSGGGSVYLVKTDPLGTMLWTRAIGGPFYEEAKSVAQTSDGGYIVAGITSSFGAGGDDVYVIKTDSMGTACNVINDTTSVTTPPSGSPNITLPVNAGGMVLSYPPIVSSNAIAATLCSVGVDDGKKPDRDFIISPNPATNEIEIRNTESEIRNIEIYNTLGEKVFELPNSNFQFSISVNVSQLRAGVYFFKLKSVNTERTAKFIKQ